MSVMLVSVQTLKRFNGLPYFLFPFRELAIKNTLWDSVIIHPGLIPRPSELGYQDHGFNLSGFSAVQDLKVCNPILLFDAQDKVQGY